VIFRYRRLRRGVLVFGLGCAVWAVFEDGGALGGLAGLAIALTAAAVGLRAWARRRRLVLDDLLSQLDQVAEHS
jgi:hypothetical protein